MIDHTRHIGIFDASRVDVSLIGAGGIGAITAVVLAKMGIQNLICYDFDQVSEENIATQFYRRSDVGTPKTLAMSAILEEFSEVSFWHYPWMVTPGTNLFHSDIIISAVDSINARQDIWQAVQHTRWQWYFDARMAAESFMLYAVNEARAEQYAAALMAQDEDHVPELPCTSKATIYTGALAAGHIGHYVRRHITGMEIPFFVSHNILAHEIITF